MSTNTNLLLKVLNVIAWIIFILLCIETGGLIVSTCVALFYNPNAVAKFWGGLNFQELYQYNQSHFVTLVVLLIIVNALKAFLFYLIVNIFHKKKLNLANPFNEKLGNYIFNLAYVAFGIGLFSYWGNNFSNWLQLIGKGVLFHNLQNLRFDGADVWLFLGVILVIFALIFKKGIEIQSENELTV